MFEIGTDGKCIACGQPTQNLGDDGYICPSCSLCYYCKSWHPRYYNNIICFECNKFDNDGNLLPIR